jgi:glycosyltransferase involved in cell wall biosynthesis
LLNGVEELIKNNIFNFHITIIGGGKVDKIKKEIVKTVKRKNLSKYITLTGRIPYDIMFQYISNADFFYLY